MKILKTLCLLGITALFVSCGNKDNSSTNPPQQSSSQSTSGNTLPDKEDVSGGNTSTAENKSSGKESPQVGTQPPTDNSLVRTEDLVGRSFDSLEQLRGAFPEYTLLLRFKDQWPAKVTKIETGENGITFKINGVPRRYVGYDGFTLQAVFLDSGNGTEAVAVFKSKKKRAS